MKKGCKTYSASFKFKVALEATKNELTANQIASKHEISKSMVSEWKKRLLENGPAAFQNREKKSQDKKEDVEFLQQQIGKLTVELEWLKKKVWS
jgi:transposase-like protein